MDELEAEDAITGQMLTKFSLTYESEGSGTSERDRTVGLQLLHVLCHSQEHRETEHMHSLN